MGTTRLMLEIEADGLHCGKCRWFDPCAAGACLIWSEAMTAGERIPECLKAEELANTLGYNVAPVRTARTI